MAIKKFIKNLFGWLRTEKNENVDSSKMITGLMRMLINTEEGEISCDDVHRVLAEFTELQRQGENISDLMPLAQKHINNCPDCWEEYQALMRVLEFEQQAQNG
jgi:hypothetical protein